LESEEEKSDDLEIDSAWDNPFAPLDINMDAERNSNSS
jgi:hypothetical protein